jgi:hypothetical protein
MYGLCSCNICISTFHGGHMTQRARDGGAAMVRMYGMSQGAMDGDVKIHGIFRQFKNLL